MAADELRQSLTQYLTTTFALVDPPVRQALQRFLEHPEQGTFRGPYLRIRTPFRTAKDGWRATLESAPEGFSPYRHQAEAFKRLSTVAARRPSAAMLLRRLVAVTGHSQPGRPLG